MFFDIKVYAGEHFSLKCISRKGISIEASAFFHLSDVES
jgi:hypothetical protein